MNSKSILTVALVLFVVAGFGYIIARPAADTVQPREPESKQAVAEAALASYVSAEPAGATDQPRLVAYYFHGNFRCYTCRAIEEYAKEAIETAFDDLIREGRVEWRGINVDEPANTHYVDDYQLVTRSVVLAQYEGGEQVQWKNLDRVWQLVRDKPAFVEYVQDEAQTYLE